MKKIYLIGIAGGSGSGKTTLAQTLAKKIGASPIHLDDYRDLTVPLEQLSGFNNFELPKYYNFSLLYDHLTQLREGRDIFGPRFHKHNQEVTNHLIKPTEKIIVEGIYLYWDKRIRELIDYKFFVDCSPEVMVSRRAKRAKTPDREYYQKVMIPHFFKFCLSQKGSADYSLDAHQTIEEIVAEVLKVLP